MSNKKLQCEIQQLDQQVEKDLRTLKQHEMTPVKTRILLQGNRGPLLCSLALAGGFLAGRYVGARAFILHRLMTQI